MSDASRSVINRGKRVITLRPSPDGAKRVLEPGKSIECLDDAEFKFLTSYHDIGDVNKIAPQLAKREEALRKQLNEAQAENQRLQSQQAKATPEPAPKPAEEPEVVPAKSTNKAEAPRLAKRSSAAKKKAR